MRGDVPAAWQENNSVLTLIFGFYFISLDNPFLSCYAKKTHQGNRCCTCCAKENCTRDLSESHLCLESWNEGMNKPLLGLKHTPMVNRTGQRKVRIRYLRFI